MFASVFLRFVGVDPVLCKPLGHKPATGQPIARGYAHLNYGHSTMAHEIKTLLIDDRESGAVYVRSSTPV